MLIWFLLYLFARLHAAQFAFSRWKLLARWSQTDHATIHLRSRHRINPRPTCFVSGKAIDCRWRRPRIYQVGPWSEEREVARGGLRFSSKPYKMGIRCHRRGIEIFGRLFSTHERTNVFVSDAWPALAKYHRPCCQHRGQRLGRSL